MKIYYITRTYEIAKDSASCGGLRNYYVELLRKKYDVVVVSPNYHAEKIIDNEREVHLPFSPNGFMSLKEAVGIYEDYMDPWAVTVIDYLKARITKEDLIFTTTGGETGCLRIGSVLKDLVGCKLIVNFHDPVDYTHIGKIKTWGKWHVSRDKIVGKYTLNADGVITWAHDYAKILMDKYPHIKNAVGIYRGYRYANITEEHRSKDEFKVIYAGAMGAAQGVEKFIKIWGDCEGVMFEITGEAPKSVQKEAAKYKNIKLLERMPHEECMNYMKREADVGVVSIIPREFGIATPSKIFDLINLGLPILGIMPPGEGQDFINRGFGLAADHTEIEKCRANLNKMMDKEFYTRTSEFVQKERPKWSMEALFEEVYDYIGRIIG